MDSKIKVIQENSDLNEEEAELALDLAEGELDQALNMVEYVEKLFITLQIKFQKGGQTDKVYGLINLIANGKSGDLLHLNVITGYEREISEVKLEISNEAFNQTIDQLEEEHGTSYDGEIRQVFYDQLHSADIFKLFTMIKEDEIRCVEGEITEILNEVFSKQVQVDVEANLITKTQVEKNLDVSIKEEKEDNKDEEKIESEETKSELSIYLKSSAVISAVKGKRVEDLEIGDKILVKIVDKREIGRYLADLISTEKSQISTGIINQIYFNEDSERYTVMVEFGPKIYGKLLVDSEVKLALAKEVEKDKEATDEIEKESNFDFIDLKNFGPLFVLFLVLIILIIILLSFI